MKTKKCTIVFEQDADGVVHCNTEIEGFNGNEIMGLLEVKKYDLFNQMMFPTKYKRIRVDNGVAVEIVKEESEGNG